MRTNVTLDKWLDADLEKLVLLANNKNVACFMTDAFPHPYTEEDGRRFMDFARSHNPQRIFAVRVNNELAGAVGIHPAADISRRNAELGYWIAEEFWGRGVATKAVKLASEIAFALPEISRLYARPFGHNHASRRVLEKCGFTLEATIKDGFFKNGLFIDELIYGRRK